MLNKKYAYEDDEPLIPKKVRTKKAQKEPKIVEEPEVYKILKETREARLQHNKPTPYGALEEVEDEDNDEVSCMTPHDFVQTKKFEGGTSIVENEKPDNISNFHPVIHEKYDEKFVHNLRGENEELKKHIDDLKQIHRYNHSLNSINHYSHQMKIRLGNF